MDENKVYDNKVTVARINEIKGELSQDQFARAIGSSQPVISKILSGYPPSITVLMGISKSFGVSVDWLLGLSDNKSIDEQPVCDEKDFYTYADIIALIVGLLKNKSVSFKRSRNDIYSDRDDESEYIEYVTEDKLIVNDRFIGDLISSANSIVSNNPETIDSWVENVSENYRIPLIQWKENYENIYRGMFRNSTSVEILKHIYQNFERVQKTYN